MITRMSDYSDMLNIVGLTEEEYGACLQDVLDKLNGVGDLEWQDIVDKYNLSIHYDTLRKSCSSAPFGVKHLIPYLQRHDATHEKYLDEIAALQKERIKVQTEKLEHARNLRAEARDELILEHIQSAIAELPKLDAPKPIPFLKHGSKEYLLVLSDQHYGIEFNIKDLFGNTINEYSPEIFEQRMSSLLSQVIETIKREDIHVLNIFELGDQIQGILRLNSQLMQLRHGIIESAILYAEYMAKWLTVLSKTVRINYQMVFDSNHNQLRICGAPKNAFPDENMSVVIKSFLKERLKGNKNINIIDNPTGMVFSTLAGSHILGIHGEVKNLERAIGEFSRIHNIQLNYLIAGHVHHADAQEVGYDAEVLHVRSVIGVDPYGYSINKTSNAGASMFVFEEGKGKVCEYTYKLN